MTFHPGTVKLFEKSDMLRINGLIAKPEVPEEDKRMLRAYKAKHKDGYVCVPYHYSNKI